MDLIPLLNYTVHWTKPPVLKFVDLNRDDVLCFHGSVPPVLL